MNGLSLFLRYDLQRRSMEERGYSGVWTVIHSRLPNALASWQYEDAYPSESVWLVPGTEDVSA